MKKKASMTCSREHVNRALINVTPVSWHTPSAPSEVDMQQGVSLPRPNGRSSMGGHSLTHAPVSWHFFVCLQYLCKGRN